MKNGLLLINLGTPNSPKPSDVRRYLAEFLTDRRVITLPAPLRYLLVYGLILPFRPRRSAHAYQKIWTTKGSPLLLHSQNFLNKLQLTLGDDWKISLGMRYGVPNLDSALKSLSDCKHITILPLFPQYSSAATGSAVAKALKILSSKTNIPPIKLIRDFHQYKGFITAQAQKIRPFLAESDFILFSYHGVPEHHLLQKECKLLCKSSCAPDSPRNESCYRAQCERTTELLAAELELPKYQFGMSFQSRLGRTPWIAPYTDEQLQMLANQGIKRLVIACPSFVADCLETLEEIGIRAREQWQSLGGNKLFLVPCLNDSDDWISSIANFIASK